MEINSNSETTWMIGDTPVRRVGFGSMRLTGHATFGAGVDRDRASAVNVVRTAVDLGVNHFDTASFFFSQSFSANEILREALGNSDELLVATKVGPSGNASGGITLTSFTCAFMVASRSPSTFTHSSNCAKTGFSDASGSQQ